MPDTAILFIPFSSSPSPIPTLISNITGAFHSIPLPPWDLTHRLLYDTSSLLPSHKSPRKYMHFLSLSHHPGRTFVGCSPGSEPASPPSIVTIPPGPPTEDFFQTVTKKMEPLWTHRAAYKVEVGIGLESTGEWEFRLGELKQGTTGQGTRMKGVIVEVVGRGMDAAIINKEEVKTWQDMVRELWDIIGEGVEGMRIMGSGMMRESEEEEGEWFTLAAQWMEVLQMR